MVSGSYPEPDVSSRSLPRIRPRRVKNFVTSILDGKAFLITRITLNLEEHILSAIHDSLCNTFTDTFSAWLSLLPLHRVSVTMDHTTLFHFTDNGK